MGLNISKKESIIGNVIEDLTNLKQRDGMSYKTIEMQQRETGSRSRLAPSPSDIDVGMLKIIEEASLLLQAKHRAGKELAHGAVAYLFGAADTHQIEFPVGHHDVDVAAQARYLFEGYEAHLGFLSSQGVLRPLDATGQIVAYGFNRVIQRTEITLSDAGNPGVIAYRDSESQRLLNI